MGMSPRRLLLSVGCPWRCRSSWRASASPPSSTSPRPPSAAPSGRGAWARSSLRAFPPTTSPSCFRAVSSSRCSPSCSTRRSARSNAGSPATRPGARPSPMSDFDLVLQGTVVTPSRVTERGWVAVRDGLVERLGSGAPLPPASGTISALRWCSPAPSTRRSIPFAKGPGGFHLVDARRRGGRRHHHRRHAVRPASSSRPATRSVERRRKRASRRGSILPSMAPCIRRTARGTFRRWSRRARPGSSSRRSEPIPTASRGFRRRSSTSASRPSRRRASSPGPITRTTSSSAPPPPPSKPRNPGLAGARPLRPPIAEALATAEVYEIGAATGCAAHIVHARSDAATNVPAMAGRATKRRRGLYLVLDEENDVRRLGGRARSTRRSARAGMSRLSGRTSPPETSRSSRRIM